VGEGGGGREGPDISGADRVSLEQGRKGPYAT
jgi:hypothetical protein